MAKFALECPHCGTVNKASTSFFAKEKIICGSCKNEIDVKANRMAVGKCKKCGFVAFDKAKGKCPICHSHIKYTSTNKASSLDELKKGSRDGNIPIILCPQCHCSIQPSEQGDSILCPVCDYHFKGFEEIFSVLQKEKLVSETGVSVIKYEGDNDTFIWKHPIEDFNLGTQLIVHESQEAIFFLNGQALDLFGPGRYSLETENLPILKKVYDLPTGKQNPFHAEVYFINRSTQMGIKWGTDSRVRFIDPETGLPLDLGASGELNLQVSDSRKLLVKLVGTNKSLSREQLMGPPHMPRGNETWTSTLQGYFRPLIVTTVKNHLANIIKTEHLDILEIDSKLEVLSSALREKISDGFEEYGLCVPQLFVTNVSLPEDDNNFKRLRNLRGAAYLGTKEAEIEAEIIAARRKRILEEETTALERAKFEAERQKVVTDTATYKQSAQNELERQKGLYEAEIMSAKGYSQRDVIQADVQKEYAHSLGQIGAGSAGKGGSGMNGSIMNDMIGLGMGMAVAGTVGGQMTDVMKKGFNPDITDKNKASGWDCRCGSKQNLGAFCSTCGKPKPTPWVCTSCNSTNQDGDFCSTCGKPKPEQKECPKCGARGVSGAFCSICGSPLDIADTWDCSCGNKGIIGNFCSNCGKKKETPDTWDCSCGNKGITGNFCSNCGMKKEDK